MEMPNIAAGPDEVWRLISLFGCFELKEVTIRGELGESVGYQSELCFDNADPVQRSA